MGNESKSAHFLTRRRFLVAATGLSLTGVAGLPTPSASALSVHPRSSWAKGRPPMGPLEAEKVKFLIVHHSASRNGHTGADAPGILRSFYDFHTGTKGWNDIAYNFLIDSDGGIWEGRKGSLKGPVAGDATGGNQGFTQLVCIIGDYNAAQPSGKSLRSLVSLLAWLADRYGVDTSPGARVTFKSQGSNRWPKGTSVTTPTITGHRTMSQTTCPGDNLNVYVVGDLMADVESARKGEAVSPTPPSTTTTTTPTTTASPTPTTSQATTPTTAPTTTTTAPTTTVPADTISNSLPPSTLSVPERTTTMPAIAPPTTVSLAAEDGGPGAQVILPLGLLGTVGAIGGLVWWRHRRMP